MRLPRHPVVRLAVFGLAGLLVIQLVPVWLLQTNPPVAAEPAWDSPATRALAQRACFDCHSNETVWPWYSKVAPAAWLVTRDVLGGRAQLNFSEWAVHAGHNHADEAGELVTSGEMPLPLYVVMHPQADLTPAERQQLADGLLRTFGGDSD
ncbi:MAG: heme-binding domain-containing protein [Anaerolineales bacterium]|nr:heme-binding domain-containing protein [Anaerolineales bacterium]